MAGMAASAWKQVAFVEVDASAFVAEKGGILKKDLGIARSPKPKAGFA